jgi:hypothetical protein
LAVSLSFYQSGLPDAIAKTQNPFKMAPKITQKPFKMALKAKNARIAAKG